MSQESVTFSSYQHIEFGLMKLVLDIFQTKQNFFWHVLFNHTLRYFISFTVVNCKLPRVTVVEINAFWRKLVVKNEQTNVKLKNSCWYEISDTFSHSTFFSNRIIIFDQRRRGKLFWSKHKISARRWNGPSLQRTQHQMRLS